MKKHGKAALLGVFGLVRFAFAACLLVGCVQYVPMRGPTIQPPAADSGRKCWQQCVDTSQSCAKACGPNLAELGRQCKDECANQRDRCQLACN
jgi:hypothetical protein